MIAVLYEHPEWFVPLFAELDRRGLPYARLRADQLSYDPAAHEAEYQLVVNRDLDFCPADSAAKPRRKIEAFTPPEWVIQAVLCIQETGGLDLGGVEYLESERDGKTYFYDINALSNFVTDAPNVVGFDLFIRLGELIESRTGPR